MKILHIGICGINNHKHGLTKAFLNNASAFYMLNAHDKHINQKVIMLTKRFKPDLVFMQIQQADKIHVGVIKHLRDIGAFVINWNGDIRDQTPQWMIDLGNYVNVTAFSNMRDVRYMRSLNMRSEWLEIWIDTKIYNPIGTKDLTVKPIVFFGNHNHMGFPLAEFRIEMCQALKSKYDNFGYYGNAPGANGSFNHSQELEASAYRNTKIAINVSHFEVEQYSSDRLLRIMATGTPICLAKYYPGIEKLFIDGVHLRTWTTLNDLYELIDYYMEHEEERAKIAQNGMEWVVKNYSCGQFVKNVMSLKYTICKRY